MYVMKRDDISALAFVKDFSLPPERMPSGVGAGNVMQSLQKKAITCNFRQP